MKRLLQTAFGCLFLFSASAQTAFTPGNLVVLQTSGTASKASSAVTLKEFTTSGTSGMSVSLPTTGPTPFQSAGIFGGSEGFLTTSTDGKYLVLAGYATSATIADITASSSATVARAIGLVYPSGYYLQVDTSNTFYSVNDIRGGVSDGTNFWAAGASNNNIDGIDYFYPGPHTALATHASTPAKAYGMRIFNGQLYYSTQKAGPSNTSSQLGVFALGTGLPTSGNPATAQIINTGGTSVPEDFSFNPTTDVCYIAINLNTVNGGIQKWTKSGGVWTLAYLLGTGVANIGAYGLVVDYSGTVPVIYATTFESTGNRVIKITDNGTLGTAVIATIVPATANTFYKGITFAPVASGTPIVNLSVSKDTASEAGVSVVTVTASASAPVTGAQTVALAVSGAGITAGDYSLSNTTITIPNGATSGSVTFTVVDDILGEGTELANLTMSSPTPGLVLGMKTTQRITITDNDGNNKPTIVLKTTTSDFIDGGVTLSPVAPFKLSGVINDPTDPASTLGVNFIVNDLETVATGLTAWVASSNTAVVPTANVSITGTDSIKNVKITPIAVGYSNITVKVTDGIDTSSYVINYAASAASATPTGTIWHTGMSDGSDAVPLDNDYYVCGDDELNVLNVYSRTASGLPVKSYDYTSNLSLPDPAKPEVDLEAATVSPKNANRIYWLGSMSNGKAPFDAKPNRDRIFATNYTGTGASTAFSFAGYTALKSSILAWGDANGYGFTASAAVGVDSKLPNGFAAEGMVFGPDSTTLYIGMRAPLVPTATRTKAVIVPIVNFETWFNNGAPSGSPVFGAPIELDLGGRGFRDMTRLSNGTYVIIAGNPGGAPLTSAIYKWTGKATDAPILVTSTASGVLNMEGVMQMNAGSVLSLTSLQVITDMGDDVFYNDGTVAKDFGDLIYRKFRSDIVTSIDLTFPEINVQGNSANINDGDVTPNAADNTDFGSVAYNSATTKTFVIQNIGTAALNVSGINFTGANTGDFSLVSAPSFPLSIPVNGTQTITVQFAPKAIGTRNATINIVSNDADEATYDIALRGNGICNSLSVYSVSGGGTICAGAAGVPVKLNSSDAGIKYQLYNGATTVGIPIAGINDTIKFGLLAVAGTYTVVATDTTTLCTQNMSGSAVINVNPLPVAYTVSGGGSYCAGGTGVSVDLLNSQTGVNYQLKLNSSAIGSPVAGTSGSAKSFGLQTGAGSYTVVGTDASTGCTNVMTAGVSVSINPLPIVVGTSGNSTCAGTNSSVSATASGGAGIKWYDLSTSGALLATASVLNIINPTGTVTYYAQAYDLTTGCISAARAVATLTVNPLPVIFNVKGGGAYCYNGSGSEITLDSSEVGIRYQLYDGVIAIGSPVTGTGFPISLGFQTVASTYTVWASNTITGCNTGMNGSRSVSINPIPAAFTITGGGAYCAGGTGMNIGLSGSVTGINYRLYNGLAPVGAAKAGTGLAISFGPQTASGSYTVVASNAVTGCSSNMTGSTSIIINPLPSAFSLTGGGAYCAGDAGVNVGLTASNSGISYQLYLGTSTAGTPITGTGSSLNFGLLTSPGTYTITATDISTGCNRVMTGSKTVTINTLPSAYNVTGGGAYCAGGTGVTVGLALSGSGISYQLYKGTSITGTPLAGTGSSLNFGLQTNAGTYTITGTDVSTGCSKVMTGSKAVIMNPLPVVFNVTGGGAYCAGGTGYHVNLNNSNEGIRYQLYNGTTAVGAPLAGTASALDYGLKTAGGTYTVIATDTLTGCVKTMNGSATITVNPVLVPSVTVAVSTGKTVCAGTSAIYSVTPVNGGTTPSYQWTVNRVNASTSGSYTYVPVNGDTVAVVMTSSEACAAPLTATNKAVMNVIKNETPSVTIATTADTVCSGSSVTLSATPIFGGTSPAYSWYVNGTKKSSAITYNYVPVDGDVVYFQLVSNYRCLTVPVAHSTDITMSVTSPIIPSVTISSSNGFRINPGQSDTLVATVTKGVSPKYQWYKGSSMIAGATSATLVRKDFANGDSITCVVTNTDACGLSSFNGVKFMSGSVLQVASVGGGIDVTVMPNPNKGTFTVKGNIGTANDEPVTLEVTNMLGQVVYTGKVVLQNGAIDAQVQLNNTVASGMYTLNVISGNERSALHIVVAQ